MLRYLQFFCLFFCKSGKIVIISSYTAFIIKVTKVKNHSKKEGAKYDDNINKVYEENHSDCYGSYGAFTDRHDRYYKHDRYDRRHKNDDYVTKKDSNKKATTSFIIGAVLGAVIAKNT